MRVSKAEYRENKQKLDMVNLSQKTKTVISNADNEKFAVITLYPKEGSLRKSFKYTYYSYEPWKKTNYANVSGSLFYGKSNMKSFSGAIGKGDEVIVDLKCFSVNKSALHEEIKPLNPKNLWSDMLDSSLKKGYTSTNQYSLNKIELTFKLAPMAIFGEIKVDEIRKITQIVPEYIANTHEQIVTYYESLTAEKALKVFFGGIMLVFSIGLTYYLFKDSISKLKKKVTDILNNKAIKSDFVLSDPADKLHCKVCKVKYSDVVLGCSHLSICMECFQKDKKCPQCGAAAKHFTKIFI